jgi:glycine cleavage system pyridoxal-binding protein P
MITSLTGLDVSNASLYDGASSLAEAALMAVRANRKSKSKRVLLAAGVSPIYRKVAQAIAGSQGLTFDSLPLDASTGVTDPRKLTDIGEPPVAVVIQQPSFFGTLEQVEQLCDWAHEQDALVIAIVNPTSLAILKAPGKWGTGGADIACGEGQPLGVPLSSGGPYFGIMACKEKIVRQMPGRIVGRTTDLNDEPGFTLTLQAREQHIRRSKATSNICTNQGLMVTAATIYMALLGYRGLQRVALACVGQTAKLAELLTAIDGVEQIFSAPNFHEVVLRLNGKQYSWRLRSFTKLSRTWRCVAGLRDGNEDGRGSRSIRDGARQRIAWLAGEICVSRRDYRCTALPTTEQPIRHTANYRRSAAAPLMCHSSILNCRTYRLRISWGCAKSSISFQASTHRYVRSPSLSSTKLRKSTTTSRC